MNKPERSADQVADLLLIGRSYSGELDDTDTDVVDLLTDIMHYCDVYAVDFGAALSSAENHYNAERNQQEEA